MKYDFAARRESGTIQNFDSASSYGSVLVGEQSFDFHGSSYSSNFPQPPTTGDPVEVTLLENSLVQVRAVQK